MTQQEFEERTGVKVNEAYYHEVIERCYMHSDIEDKDTFCHWWREAHKGMTEQLAEQIGKEIQPIMEGLQKEAQEAKEKLSKTYERLYELSIEDSYPYELRTMCVNFYGWAEYLRRKLTDKEELEDDEMDKLVEILDHTIQ